MRYIYIFLPFSEYTSLIYLPLQITCNLLAFQCSLIMLYDKEIAED